MRTCDVCDFEFKGRADARYCSPACKQAAYRKRTEAAEEAAFQERQKNPATYRHMPRKKRPPLEPQVSRVAYDLSKLAARLEKLIEDDRYPKNSEMILARNRWLLQQTQDVLTKALAAGQP